MGHWAKDRVSYVAAHPATALKLQAEIAVRVQTYRTGRMAARGWYIYLASTRYALRKEMADLLMYLTAFKTIYFFAQEGNSWQFKATCVPSISAAAKSYSLAKTLPYT